jgi:hypothetical protein
VGLLANLIHVGTGEMVPAQFTGLTEKKVAVICVSNASAFGPTAASSELGRKVAAMLGQQVRKIEVVDPQEVADWIDQNGWDQLDYTALGEGVGAQMLVSIDLNTFSLHDGPTLYKGRADVRLRVYDIEQDGKVVFDKEPPQIQFPIQAGYYTSEISEREFRRKFLAVLAQRIARHFFAYELIEDFAQDTTLIGQG